MLELTAISKAFDGIQALRDVDFRADAGEVHCLVGQNGAGKSTMIKVICGVVHADAGIISIDGSEVRIWSPRDAAANGISVVHQDFSLVPDLSVAENVFLGSWIRKRGVCQWKEMFRETEKLLEKLGVSIDPTEKVKEISSIERKLVGIARAMYSSARIFILDEPTAALGVREKERLFEIIAELKKGGAAVIYISHDLDEIFATGDRVSILRDGRMVFGGRVEQADRNLIVRHMINRDIGSMFPGWEQTEKGPELLRVEDLSDGQRVRNISFSVRGGEVLGIAGLVGSGRTEILRAIFGITRRHTGKVFLKSREVTRISPLKMKKYGVALVPEDRTSEGLIASFPLVENMSLCNLDIVSTVGFMSSSREKAYAATLVKEMRITAKGIRDLARNLSGGNQQKLLVGRWLIRASQVILLDEPTKGIDVGAKAEIYRLIRSLAKQGRAIVLISSELPEIYSLSDRMIVIRHGEKVRELRKEETSYEELLAAL